MTEKIEKIEQTIGFVGGGAMAQAIAEGLIQSGTVPAGKVFASAATDRTKSWWSDRDVQFSTDNAVCVEASQVVVIAVKPHLYSDVLKKLQLSGNYPNRLWVSIMAGVVLDDLSQAVKAVTGENSPRIVRTIPNTPVKVRQGSVGVTYNENCTSSDKATVDLMFSSVSRSVEIPERLQNAFAAMAGSGPAYIYQVIEALADGGVMMGLPRDLANEHAAAMVQGAASMVLEGAKEGKHSAKLKDEVCSPGGSTIRGVQKLEQGGVRAAFMSAVQAAAERNVELGKK